MIGIERGKHLVMLALALFPAAATLLSAPVAVRPAAVDTTPFETRYAASHEAMLRAGPPYNDWDGRFLEFDPSGDGRVAQVFGDLSTADRIAVLVPGAGNRLANFERGVGGKALRSPAVQAAELYKAVRRDGFAVVAWLGYDAPNALDRTAAREDLARDGAVALERFVEGLLAIRPHATVALLGHSYGGVVIGLAAPWLDPRVTDLAVFGCPGMGVDDVAELHTTARVWAGLAGGDPMRWVPGIRLFGLGHGQQPTDPAFGARVFGTGGVLDHDQYLAPGTESLANLARIAGHA
jgi:hypothetical protein